MEKKSTIISLIVILVIIATAIGYIIISGIVAKGYNYVQIEVNPRVEFLCDKKFDVVSAYPLNEDAKIILSDLNLVGLDIEDATTLFIDECARCGYIDVDGLNNATNITVIDGITQALDVHIVQDVYNYFRKNTIMSVVTETYEDRSMFDAKKKNKINCSNKYKLITTLIEKDNNYKIDDLKKLSEVELVDLVKEKHNNNPFVTTQELINIKQELKNNNIEKYAHHITTISSNSQKEFSTLFDKHQRLSGKKYLNNFTKEYLNWQKQYS